jgi:DNA-binding NtrC family response regulator
MKEEISALLVQNEAEPLDTLEIALRAQSIKTFRARNCQEASLELARATPVHLVFTDSTLPDGTWRDVLGLAAKAPAPVDVIVVARLVDIRLYIEVIESGAFDFITPPFAACDVAHVIRCAAQDVVRKRHAHGGAA